MDTTGSGSKRRTHGERSRRAGTRGRVLVATAGALLLLSAPARANELGAIAADAGWGAASALSTLIYAPFKMAFAIGGGVVGGLTWAFSGGDAAAAKAVIVPSASGDYLVTRDHLEGRRALRFFGPGPAEPQPDVAAGR